MIIYYAHSMLIYNTLQEEKELVDIKKGISTNETVHIINPNGWIYDGQGTNGKQIMEQCYKLIDNSDVIVFSTIEHGVLGRGVYCEIERALNRNKKVYYLLRGALVPFYTTDYHAIELIDNGQSWKRYAKINRIV